jgi:CheY-like chemotaxis protein
MSVNSVNQLISDLVAPTNEVARVITAVAMDDDVRSIFAINSVLESRKMKVLHAEHGNVGIKLLKENPDIDLILMDTMMPEMDGLTATQEIRKLSKFKRLPIISLTAKAMKGDREKALEAGASDYVTKPVDPEKLLSVMHIWLIKQSKDVRPS